jgi:uncharacterized damage-inducible protein DinB
VDRPAAPLLAARCRAAFFGPCWHGPSVRASLASVSPELALAKPHPGGHSIAELVGHMVFWQDDGINRLKGKGKSATPELNFPDPDTSHPDWWKHLKLRLRASQNLVLATIFGLEPEQLDRRLSGRKYPVWYMLDGLADHAIYHAGQISHIKKAALRGVSVARPSGQASKVRGKITFAGMSASLQSDRNPRGSRQSA